MAVMTDLEQELRRVVEGDVRFDQYSRLLYSTDASMYQMEPIGVVIPRHAGDVQAVLELPDRESVAVLPRGGGTSLTGQTVSRAVVMDFSRWMQDILEVNREERERRHSSTLRRRAPIRGSPHRDVICQTQTPAAPGASATAGRRGTEG